MLVYKRNFVQVCLEYVIHVDGPELLVTEWLPRLGLEVNQHTFLNHLLCRLIVSLDNFRLQVLDVGEANEYFEEFKASQAIAWRGTFSHFKRCCDVGTIDC